MFTYRHAIALYLKAILRQSARSHDLRPLCARLVRYARAALEAEIPDWAEGLIMEFATNDPRSTAFRYESETESYASELWVDFIDLRDKMERMKEMFHVINAVVADEQKAALWPEGSTRERCQNGFNEIVDDLMVP